jgi:hypothetical protein
MKRTIWLILGAIVLVLGVGILAIAQGDVPGWTLARLGLPIGRTQTPMAAPPANPAPMAASTAAPVAAPSSEPVPSAAPPVAVAAPIEPPPPAPPKPIKRPVDRHSNAYICAHGDPADYRTTQACDRKDWAATDRANR